MPMEAAPHPGAVEALSRRLTALPRPWIRPRLIEGNGHPHHRPDDPAVRRFWSALIGPGAVADLLRLTAAARSGRRLRRPVHLQVLFAEGLAHWDGRHILVHGGVPQLDEGQIRRLRPALRVEYRRSRGR
jgi:hypothetical protein